LLSRTSQPVATVGTTRAHHQTGLAQSRYDLLEVRQRQTLGVGDRLQARRLLGVLAPELDHQADAILGLGGEDHAAHILPGGSVIDVDVRVGCFSWLNGSWPRHRTWG